MSEVAPAKAVVACICVRCNDASEDICPKCGRCPNCPPHPGCVNHGK